MYMTREIENNDYQFIHFFRSGTGGIQVGNGASRRGGRTNVDGGE